MSDRTILLRGLCETEGCYNIGLLTKYKGKFACASCINPLDKPQRATDFTIKQDNTFSLENYGEKYNFGDILHIQYAIGQRRRLHKSR